MGNSASKTRKIHRPTKDTRATVLEMRANGALRKEIAQRLRIRITTLKARYPKELKKGDILKERAAAGKLRPGLRSVAVFQSRFIPGTKVPDNCIVPPEMLAKYAHLIAKYDEHGNPCTDRGTPVFGKKMMEDFIGRGALNGTRWEHVMKNSENYSKISIASKPWDLSLPDWEKRIMAGESLLPIPLPSNLKLHATEIGADNRFGTSASFNIELAQRALVAFNNLRLADVTGTPAMSEAGADWFREVIAAIFGSYDPVTKTRMVKELFLLVPKKNNKTTGGALIMLLLLIFNERPNGQAIMTAPERKVAQIAFDAIEGAIALDPVLEKLFIVKSHKKTVIDRRTNAELLVMTFDVKALTGQKLFAALIDELHILAKVGGADKAIRQIRGGMMPFPEAILIIITTQSEEAPIGVFKSELNSARDIRDGKRSGSKNLPILYEFPQSIQLSKDQQWRNPKRWPFIAPNIGKSIDVDTLVTSFKDAESKGEAELRSWGSQHLNIEIGVALRSDSWSGAYLWEGSQHPTFTGLDDLLAACEVVVAGIDGGGMEDLLSLAITGRETGTGAWLTWTHSWLSKVALERRKTEEDRLKDFVASGCLTIVERMGEDVEQLVEIIERCEKAGLLGNIGLDPYGVGTIVDELLVSGIAQERIVGISQGWRLGGAIKTAERSLAEGRLMHCGQPIMAWAVGNAKIEPRGNAALITKQASGAGKIDPVMAMFDSIHLIAANPASKSKKFQMYVFGGKQNLQSRGAGR